MFGIFTNKQGERGVYPQQVCRLQSSQVWSLALPDWYGRAAVHQRDVDKMEIWVCRKLVEFNKGNAQSHARTEHLHATVQAGSWLGADLQKRMTALKHELWEVKKAKEYGAILARVKAANHRMLAPFYVALKRLHLNYCVQFWPSQYKTLERAWQESVKIRGNIPYENKLRELVLISLKERALLGNLTAFFFPSRKIRRRWSLILLGRVQWQGKRQ